MIYFHNDYHDMCHWAVLEKMNSLHQQPMPGYGEDPCCEKAAQKIKALCGREDVAVHFLVGGTQTNLTVILPSSLGNAMTLWPVASIAPVSWTLIWAVCAPIAA